MPAPGASLEDVYVDGPNPCGPPVVIQFLRRRRVRLVAASGGPSAA